MVLWAKALREAAKAVIGRTLACLNLRRPIAFSPEHLGHKAKASSARFKGADCLRAAAPLKANRPVFVRRPHQKQLTLPAQHAVGRRRPQAEALGQQRALRGDAGGRRQNDGGVPRTQRHRALHPVRDEYCKFDPADLISAPPAWRSEFRYGPRNLSDFGYFLLFWRSGCQTLPRCQPGKCCEHHCDPADCSDRRPGESLTRTRLIYVRVSRESRVWREPKGAAVITEEAATEDFHTCTCTCVRAETARFPSSCFFSKGVTTEF